MQRSSREWLIPLTGVLFIIVVIVAFILGGEPPEAKEGGVKILQHYRDNKGSIQASSLLIALGMLLFVFFWGYLRQLLREAEGPNGMLSALILVGAAIFATGAAIDATIAFALAEAADDIRPVAAQAIEAIWDNDFLPLGVGVVVIDLAAGISIIRHGVLPKWMGWILVVLAIVGATPAGFISFLATGLWILIASVLLSLRARRGPQTPAPGTAPA
jgi:hypothetical protein